jgi:ketosteroid isomerase-like protein
MSTTQQVPRTFDWPAFRRAYERFDTEALRQLVTDDIVYTEIDSRTPPSSPRVVEGVEALVAHGDAGAQLGIETRAYDEVLGDERIAFTAECRYPDGGLVLGMATLHIEDGLVTRMTAVQAFDEASS